MSENLFQIPVIVVAGISGAVYVVFRIRDRQHARRELIAFKRWCNHHYGPFGQPGE